MSDHPYLPDLAGELDPYDYFAHEDAYPDLDLEAAVRHLQEAIRCATDNTEPARTDFTQFDRIHRLFRQEYPHIMEAGTYEEIGHSVLITLPGTDPTLEPMQLMAHQDIVPQVPGTEGDWVHGAFEGVADDEFIWGRGALDMKEMLIGHLEAVEYVLAHGGQLRRTLYLAFGEDEERWGTGAQALCQHHRERGVHLGLIVDEGGSMIEDAAIYGAPGVPISCVALAEKGFVDVRLEAAGDGGHSSNPYGGTSMGRLCEAVADVVRAPFAPRLVPVLRDLLAELAPHITAEPLASYVAGGRESIDAHAEDIARLWAESPRLSPYVQTTIAPTMIEGASTASNVLPGNMTAVVNLRVLPGETVDSVVSHVREAVRTPGVEVVLQQGIEPSKVARTDTWGLPAVLASLRHFYAGVTFATTIMKGGSDAQYYDDVCDCALRADPFRVPPSERVHGEHGTNERISRRSFAQGIRVLIHLVESTCL